MVLLLGSLMLSGPLSAQISITPVSPGSEKRPSPRDPKASQPLMPEHSRRKLDSSAGTLFKPNGEIDMDKYAERRRQMEEKKERASRYDEREIQDALEEPAGKSGSGEERIFHRALSSQFGVEAPRISNTLERESHRETRGERFQIIFILAAPFTCAASYGVFSLLKSATAHQTRLSAGETIGFFVTGFGLAGGIAYYDYRQPVQTDQAAALLQEKMFFTHAASGPFDRAEWNTPLVSFRFSF